MSAFVRRGPLFLSILAAHGLFDMQRNVMQWCQDHYASDGRSANRAADLPVIRYHIVGFRVARSYA